MIDPIEPAGEEIGAPYIQQFSTEGGSVVQGSLTVEGGDFVGRDQYKTTVVSEDSSFDVRGLPNPYLGLRAFTYSDQAAFGGRKQAVAEALARLIRPSAKQVVLFITGASGSGKSSFAQAGLLPALEAHYLERRRQISRAVFRPSSDPLAMLADALALLGLPELSSQELGRFTPEEFARFLSENTPNNQVNLLVIDQFEELFTQSAPAHRDILFSFLACLEDFEQVRTHIIPTMRSDFLDDLFQHKQAWDLAMQGIGLRAMTESELKDAIQQPIWAACSAGKDDRLCQKRCDPALLERLAQDASREAAFLPLLQMTIQEMWSKGSLRLGEYTSLTEAIRRRADTIYRYEDYESSSPQKERPAEDQQAILEIFLDLVNVSLSDDAHLDVRRRRPDQELIGGSSQKQRLVEELVSARLLSAGEEMQGSTRVETLDIIHESLINNWDRLRQAIASQREKLRRRARFEQQLKEWLANGRSDGYVLTGVRRAEARELERENDISLKGTEAKEFLRRSDDLAEAAEKQRLRRIMYVAVALSVALLVSVVAAGFAVRSSFLTNQAKETALAERALAVAAQSTAEAESIRADRERETAVAERSRADHEREAALLAKNFAEAESLRANVERDRAEQQAEISLVRQLSAQAQELYNKQPHLLSRTLLLAVETLHRNSERSVNQLIYESLPLVAFPITRMDHDYQMVRAVAFSPDGLWVASGSSDNRARVWEVESGREAAFWAHEDRVNSVAFSPDGRWVLSGSSDGSAVVWETATGKEVSQVSHAGPVNSVAFSRDGWWAVSGSSDGTAIVWEAGTGVLVETLHHDAGINSVAFSMDTRWEVRVVTASDDFSVRVWGAATGREISRMEHDSWVNSAVFSPDGSQVLSGSYDRTARVWEAVSGREVARTTHKLPVLTVIFSPDGSWAASGSMDKTARIWDANTGREVSRFIHEDWVRSIAFSPDSSLVFSGSDDRTARIWLAETGEELVRMTHDSWVFAVAFSAEGDMVVSASDDGMVTVWGATRQEVGRQMNHEDSVRAAAFNHDGALLASGSWDGRAVVWNAETGQEVTSVLHDDNVQSLAFSPDGKFVVTGSYDDAAAVWDAETGDIASVLLHDDNVNSVAFSPDGYWVVTGSADDTARVWKAATGVEISKMEHQDDVNSVAFNPDGKWIVTSSADFTARVWEAVTGAEISVMVHEDVVNTAAFSPDGKRIVTASGDGTARVWDAQTGAFISEMSHQYWVYSAMFSFDGTRIVTSSSDKTARVWDVETGKEIARLTHEGYVRMAVFSADGNWIVSGGDDKTARVWEAETGKEVARMTHEDWLEAVAFSPDGGYVLSSSGGGAVRVWLWRPEDLIDTVCSVLDRNLSQEEWTQYFGLQPYRQTCPDLPPGE